METKVAVITDVHGNAPALRAAMAAIDRRGDVSHIYCLGDMISIGPDTNEVLGILTDRADLTMLTGNHEQYVLALATGRDPGLQGEELEHQKWMAARLDGRFIPFLAALPWSLTVEHGEYELLLQHYHLVEGPWFGPIDPDPSAARLDAIYGGATADVVCFGHHHIVHHFRSGRRLYVNPGSLGCCQRPVARYGVLDLSGREPGVELAEAPYDNRGFLASYEQLGVPGRELILKIFHGNQHLGMNQGYSF